MSLLNVRPAGPITVCPSLTTFLTSYLPPFRLPSCLYFRLPVYFIFYLHVYSPTFLSTFHSFCLTSVPPFCQPFCLSPPSPYNSVPACLRLQPLTCTTDLGVAVRSRFGRWSRFSGWKSMFGSIFKILVQKR